MCAALVAIAIAAWMAGIPTTGSAAAASPLGVAPTSLTVDQLASPVDVENLTGPLLGWHVGAGTQSAYQVQVATSAAALGTPDVWDSGKVTSAENSNIAYAGQALTTSNGYYWRVRTWDQADNPSAWSAAARFGTDRIEVGRSHTHLGRHVRR
jgi:hypothetical protein